MHRTTPTDNLVAITASDPSQLTPGGNVLIACVMPPLQPAVREAMRISPASDKRPDPTKARDPGSAIGARVTAGGVAGVVFAFEERKGALGKAQWVPYSRAGGILYRVRSDDGADAGTFALAGAAAAAAAMHKPAVARAGAPGAFRRPWPFPGSRGGEEIKDRQ